MTTQLCLNKRFKILYEKINLQINIFKNTVFNVVNFSFFSRKGFRGLSFDCDCDEETKREEQEIVKNYISFVCVIYFIWY